MAQLWLGLSEQSLRGYCFLPGMLLWKSDIWQQDGDEQLPHAFHAGPTATPNFTPWALHLASREESSTLFLSRCSWPGFCKGCWTPDVKGGIGVPKIFLSHPGSETPPSHTAGGRGGSGGPRAGLLGGSSKNTNLGGQMHGSTRLYEILACKGL